MVARLTVAEVVVPDAGDRDERHNDGSRAVSPWLSALDPGANLRALTEVQRRGLRAAGALVDRLASGLADLESTAGVTGSTPSGGERGGPPSAAGNGAGAAADLTGLAEAWGELARRSMLWWSGPAADRDGTDTSRRTDSRIGEAPTGSSAVCRVVIPAAVGSNEAREATGELWLHNSTRTEWRDLRVHCGPLLANGGSVLDSCISFDPAQLDVLPGRSSRGVAVSVVAHAHAPSGTYRGLVLVAGLPDVWSVLEVVIEP
jgi:hypothetical protein